MVTSHHYHSFPLVNLEQFQHGIGRYITAREVCHVETVIICKFCDRDITHCVCKVFDSTNVDTLLDDDMTLLEDPDPLDNIKPDTISDRHKLNELK